MLKFCPLRANFSIRSISKCGCPEDILNNEKGWAHIDEWDGADLHENNSS
jgi:hypothetical protein